MSPDDVAIDDVPAFVAAIQRRYLVRLHRLWRRDQAERAARARAALGSSWTDAEQWQHRFAQLVDVDVPSLHDLDSALVHAGELRRSLVAHGLDAEEQPVDAEGPTLPSTPDVHALDPAVLEPLCRQWGWRLLDQAASELDLPKAHPWTAVAIDPLRPTWWNDALACFPSTGGVAGWLLDVVALLAAEAQDPRPHVLADLCRLAAAELLRADPVIEDELTGEADQLASEPAEVEAERAARWIEEVRHLLDAEPEAVGEARDALVRRLDALGRPPVVTMGLWNRYAELDEALRGSSTTVVAAGDFAPVAKALRDAGHATIAGFGGLALPRSVVPGTAPVLQITPARAFDDWLLGFEPEPEVSGLAEALRDALRDQDVEQVQLPGLGMLTVTVRETIPGEPPNRFVRLFAHALRERG